MTHINEPMLWRTQIPVPEFRAYKYERGAAVIFGGAVMTGAARLSASACARMGAGVTIVAAPTKTAAAIYRSTLPAHIIVEDKKSPQAHLADKRRTAVLIGPGAGRLGRGKVLSVLDTKKPCVIDADALTAFEGDSQSLFGRLHAGAVLTPHEGEFKRLFPGLEGSCREKVERAAKQAGCVVLLKGADSAIAAPGLETLIHQDAVPYLATAGSGDVLAGMITGFIAQGMTPYAATAAAVYMHRMMGAAFGPGLVASDLVEMIPWALKSIIS